MAEHFSSSSSSSSSSPNINSDIRKWNNPDLEEVRAFELAREGKLSELQELFSKVGNGWSRQYFLDMAIMGAHEGKKEPEYMWAWKNGASLLWGIQQPKRDILVRDREHTYPKNLSMLRGPGEVAKGTFKD